MSLRSRATFLAKGVAAFLALQKILIQLVAVIVFIWLGVTTNPSSRTPDGTVIHTDSSKFPKILLISFFGFLAMLRLLTLKYGWDFFQAIRKKDLPQLIWAFCWLISLLGLESYFTWIWDNRNPRIRDLQYYFMTCDFLVIVNLCITFIIISWNIYWNRI